MSPTIPIVFRCIHISGPPCTLKMYFLNSILSKRQDTYKKTKAVIMNWNSFYYGVVEDMVQWKQINIQHCCCSSDNIVSQLHTPQPFSKCRKLKVFGLFSARAAAPLSFSFLHGSSGLILGHQVATPLDAPWSLCWSLVRRGCCRMAWKGLWWCGNRGPRTRRVLDEALRDCGPLTCSKQRKQRKGKSKLETLF